MASSHHLPGVPDRVGVAVAVAGTLAAGVFGATTVGVVGGLVGVLVAIGVFGATGVGVAPDPVGVLLAAGVAVEALLAGVGEI